MAQFETVALPLYDVPERVAPSLESELRLEPRAIPEMVEFESFAFAIEPASIALVTPEAAMSRVRFEPPTRAPAPEHESSAPQPKVVVATPANDPAALY